MSVEALVGATRPEALLPFAGSTVVEHQVRRLAAAGARRTVLLLDRWDPALAAPLARLRADGLAVEAVLAAADAAARLAEASHVLLAADACLPPQALIDRVAEASVPALAVVADAPGHDGFERIDAGARWAGLALLDGRRVAETATTLGDWDAVSTLLRRAVQEGAARIDAGDAPPTVALSTGAVLEAEAALVAATREAPRDWADRHVLTPLAEALLPRLFARRLEPGWLAQGAAALALAGGLLALAGLRWTALVPLLAAGSAARMAKRLALIQARRIERATLLARLRSAGAALAAAGLGRSLWLADGQWGWLVVAAAAVAAVPAIGAERRLLGWLGYGVAPLWLASEGDLPWALLPLALAGAWGAGLAGTAIYALGSLAWLMWRGLRLTR